MRTEIIKIEDRNIVDELEMLSIEVNSRKELLSFMIQNNSYVIAKDAFNIYHKEYQDFFIKYEQAKSKLQENYILNKFEGSIDWSLDFVTGELTVIIKN